MLSKLNRTLAPLHFYAEQSRDGDFVCPPEPASNCWRIRCFDCSVYFGLCKSDWKLNDETVHELAKHQARHIFRDCLAEWKWGQKRNLTGEQRKAKAARRKRLREEAKQYREALLAKDIERALEAIPDPGAFRLVSADEIAGQMLHSAWWIQAKRIQEALSG